MPAFGAGGGGGGAIITGYFDITYYSTTTGFFDRGALTFTFPAGGSHGFPAIPAGDNGEDATISDLFGVILRAKGGVGGGDFTGGAGGAAEDCLGMAGGGIGAGGNGASGNAASAYDFAGGGGGGGAGGTDASRPDGGANGYVPTAPLAYGSRKNIAGSDIFADDGSAPGGGGGGGCQGGSEQLKSGGDGATGMVRLRVTCANGAAAMMGVWRAPVLRRFRR